MTDEIAFGRSATTAAGTVARLSPLVRRIIAGNGGPMTFTGTCSYIVGHGKVAIIDPGPDDPAHVASLLAAVAGESVEQRGRRRRRAMDEDLRAAADARDGFVGRHRAGCPVGIHD